MKYPGNKYEIAMKNPRQIMKIPMKYPGDKYEIAMKKPRHSYEISQAIL